MTRYPLRAALTCLGTGVIEFAGLTNYNWPGADNQNGFYVCAFCHIVCYLCSVLLHGSNETIKQVTHFMWTRTRLGMPLKTECGFVDKRYSLQAVIE